MNVTFLPATPFLDPQAAFTLVSLTMLRHSLLSADAACFDRLSRHLYSVAQEAPYVSVFCSR